MFMWEVKEFGLFLQSERQPFEIWEVLEKIGLLFREGDGIQQVVLLYKVDNGT